MLWTSAFEMFLLLSALWIVCNICEQGKTYSLHDGAPVAHIYMVCK